MRPRGLAALLAGLRPPLYLVVKKVDHQMFNRRARRYHACMQWVLKAIVHWRFGDAFVKRRWQNHDMERHLEHQGALDKALPAFMSFCRPVNY